MERFVFVVAVSIAVLFGIGALFRDHFKFHMDFDDDGGGTAPIVQTTAGRLEAQAYQGDYLQLKHLAAIVTVTPEDRADYMIEIDSPGGTPMPTVSADEGRVTVDGQLRGRIARCNDDDGAVDLRGYDDVTVQNLPRINIRAPRALRITRGGAGATEIGASESLALELHGCGPVTVGDVAGEFSLEIAGAGDVTGGAARRLVAEVNGAGEITVGTIAEGADLDIDGAGTISIAALTGDLSVDANGAGDVDIRGGSIGEARLDLNGLGDVEIAAPVRTLNVSIAGVGDVDVSGVVGDLTADISGPGSITVQSLTGSLQQDINGPGSVRVGRRDSGGGEAPANAP